MTSFFKLTRRHLFGAGGTLGGVKKLAVEKIDYDQWQLKEATRRMLASVHHPLVLEYMMRLHNKHRSLERAQEEDASGNGLRKLTNANGTPFDMVRWNAQYRDELDCARKLSDLLHQLDENVALRDEQAAKGGAAVDRELQEMVEEDMASLVEQVRDLDDEVSTIMERRLGGEDVVGSSSRVWNITVAGKAGGEEAGLFASELAEMFRCYASEVRGLKVTLGDGGGGTEGKDQTLEPGVTRLRLEGPNVYRYFHHEIGVHKVQRVPVTDAAGKMQTSTAVVTMMPELDPVSVNVHESDCTIDYVRGSGPGGQGMQSSSNCVVLTHRPSGISVKCHQSRSALGNKELALQMVAQQILTAKVKEQNSLQHRAWETQWTSGERSDKMRTYNYPQNRVTEHRLGKDYPLVAFMERGSGLKGLHDEMNAVEDSQQLVTVLMKHLRGDFGSSLD